MVLLLVLLLLTYGPGRTGNASKAIMKGRENLVDLGGVPKVASPFLTY